MRAATLWLLLTSVIVASGSTATATGPIKIGKPFPDLVLPDIADGQPRSIVDFRGRKVILHIFASW